MEGCVGGGGGEGDYIYTYRYTVTTRMTPALRWAATSAILMFPINCEGQSHKTVSTDLTRQCPQNTTFEERRAEADANRNPSAYQPKAHS